MFTEVAQQAINAGKIIIFLNVVLVGSVTIIFLDVHVQINKESIQEVLATGNQKHCTNNEGTYLHTCHTIDLISHKYLFLVNFFQTKMFYQHWVVYVQNSTSFLPKTKVCYQ